MKKLLGVVVIILTLFLNSCQTKNVAYTGGIMQMVGSTSIVFAIPVAIGVSHGVVVGLAAWVGMALTGGGVFFLIIGTCSLVTNKECYGK